MNKTFSYYITCVSESRCWYKELGNVVFALALITIVYCPISVYRINYLISCLIVLIILHQLFAPDKSNVQENLEDNDENNISSMFEKIKTKLE